MEVGIAGEFKWEVRKVEDDSLVSSGDWQPNLILDQCFTEAAKIKHITGHMQLGTGGTAPKITDTKLENAYENWHTRNSEIIGGYSVESWTFPSKNIIVSTIKFIRRFRPRAAVNLAELGLLMNSSVLATRALFKNSSGPTTVTVLPDEYIDIHYRLWGKYDTTKVNVSIPYKKKSRGTDLESETWSTESKIILAFNASTIYSCRPIFDVSRIDTDVYWATENIDLESTTNLYPVFTYSPNLVTFKPASSKGEIKYGNLYQSFITWSGEYSGGVLTYTGVANGTLSLRENTYKNITIVTKFVSFSTNFLDKVINKTATQTVDFTFNVKVTRYTGSLDDLKEGTSYAP